MKTKTITLTRDQAEFAIAELLQRAKMLSTLVHEKTTSEIVMTKAITLNTLIKDMEAQLS